MNDDRKHPRIPLKHKVLSISADGIGPLLNISEGGFSAKFIKNGYKPSGSWKINFTNYREDTFVHAIKYKIMWLQELDPSNDLETYPIRLGAQFLDISKQQKKQLQKLIASAQS